MRFTHLTNAATTHRLGAKESQRQIILHSYESFCQQFLHLREKKESHACIIFTVQSRREKKKHLQLSKSQTDCPTSVCKWCRQQFAECFQLPLSKVHHCIASQVALTCFSPSPVCLFFASQKDKRTDSLSLSPHCYCCQSLPFIHIPNSIPQHSHPIWKRILIQRIQ